jgi:hypothetical protein
MQMDRSLEAAAARDWYRRRKKYLANYNPKFIESPPEKTPKPEKINRKIDWSKIDLNLQGKFMHFDYDYWQENFIENLQEKIGEDYILGGGNMATYNGMPNRNVEGEWIGFDCSGGVMDAMRDTTEINLKLRNPTGIKKAPWVYEISENELIPGDLIIVDLPEFNEREEIKLDKNGNINYGIINHVMTYIGPQDDGKDLITTEGSGGDHRLNPNYRTDTRFYNLDRFRRISNRFTKGNTLFY